MCGIIAGFNTKTDASVNEWIVDQFEEQHSRGTEGFGIIRFNFDGTELKVDRATESAKFMFDLHKTKSQMMLAHHRNPTSTDNKLKQTHPIRVSHKDLKFDYLVIHNGVITNSSDLYDLHTKLGYEYTTEEISSKSELTEFVEFNDSEGLAIEVARYIEKHTTEVGTLGSVAFIALQLDKKTEKVIRVYFGRNTNPLNMHRDKTELLLSSEGKGEPTKANVLYSFKLRAKLKLKEEPLDWAKPPEVKKTTIGYDTQTVFKKGKRQTWWEKDDDEYWPSYGKKDNNIFFTEVDVEEAYEKALAILESHLDMLDSPYTIDHADVKEALKELEEVLEETRLTLNEKYAKDNISKHGDDTQGTATGSEPLPANSEAVETPSLYSVENKVKSR